MHRFPKLKLFLLVGGIAAWDAEVHAAPITSDWTPGTADNWDAGAADVFNWSHSSAPATTSFPSNVGGDTFSVNISGASSSNVGLNTSVTIDALDVDATNTLSIQNGRKLTIAPGGGIANDGTISVNAAGASTGLHFQNSATISGNGAIDLSDDGGNSITTGFSAATVANGAGHTIRGSGAILNNIGGFDNAGSIVADNNAPLTLDPGAIDFTNTGTLRAESGGTLIFNAGNYVNTGGSIEADGVGSSVLLNSSVTVSGGTLTSANGGAIASTDTTGGAILDGVTVSAGTDIVQGNGADFQVANGVTNNGTWSLGAAGSATVLMFNGNQTIGGTGEVVLSDNGGNQIRTQTASHQLTVGADQTIRGAGQMGLNLGGFANDGTILQQGTNALVIDPGGVSVGGTGANFVNNGVLRTEGAGGLTLNGGIYQNNTAIETTGAGNILLGSVATTIRGGDIDTNGGSGVLTTNVVSTGALLEDVRLTSGSEFVLGNGGDIRLTNFVNDGTVSVNSTGGSNVVTFVGSQTLAGSGEIAMSDNGGNLLRTSTNLETLTIGAGQTVRGAGAFGGTVGGYVNDGAIVQQGTNALIVDPGTVDADGSGANFVNNGVLRSEGSGGITFGPGIFRNNTAIETTGSGDLLLSSSAVTIRGGDIDTNGGSGVLTTNVVSSGAVLEDVRLTSGSEFVLGNGADIRLSGFVNDGTVSVNSSGGTNVVQFLGNQTLAGSGEVVLNDSGGNQVRLSDNLSTLTVGADQTIRGAGLIGANIGGYINDGTILQQGNTALTLDPGTAVAGGSGANFVNNGVLRSEGSGGLTLNAGIYRNNTAIETTGGGDIFLSDSGVTIRGGDLTTSGGGAVRTNQISNGAVLEDVRLTAGSEIALGNGHDIRLSNGMVNDGTISSVSAGGVNNIIFNNSMTLGGSGEVVLNDSTGNVLRTTSNLSTVTVGADQTIRGAGNIGGSLGSWINEGTIVAEAAVNQLTLAAGVNFTNQGTLRAAGGAGPMGIDAGTKFTQAGGLIDVEAGGDLRTFNGDFVQTGGHTRVNGTMTAFGSSTDIELQGGSIGGSGLVTFGGVGTHVLNNSGGTLAAGNSPGILTLENATYRQGAGGTFEYELDGIFAGVGHDLLSILNGDADLGGTLSIVADLTFASTLSIGDQFEVVRLEDGAQFLGADLTDQFFDTLTVNLTGLDFTQVFVGNSLFIEVVEANLAPGAVPEPEGLLLLLSGVGLLAAYRRRRATLH